VALDGRDQLAFAAGGGLLAVTTSPVIRLLDPRTAGELGVLDPQGEVRSLAASPDGRLLAAMLTSGIVRLWKLPLNDLPARSQRRARGRSDAEAPCAPHYGCGGVPFAASAAASIASRAARS
jgi:hypothetical protein